MAARATKRLEVLASRQLNAFLQQGWPFNAYAQDPKRIEELRKESENLRQIQDQWERIWFEDRPSHLTPDRVNGGIDDTPVKTKAVLERQLEKKLQTPVNMQVVNQPLEKVLETLGDQVETHLFLDRAAIVTAGINVDRPVTLHVKDLSFKSTLNLALQPFHLTYLIRDEVVVITTPEQARPKLVTKAYQIQDFVEKKAASSPVNGPAGVNQVDQPEERLIRLIVQTISPPSWASTGGAGTIEYFPLSKSLVVNQTQDVQEEIYDLLMSLRRPSVETGCCEEARTPQNQAAPCPKPNSPR